MLATRTALSWWFAAIMTVKFLKHGRLPFKILIFLYCFLHFQAVYSLPSNLIHQNDHTLPISSNLSSQSSSKFDSNSYVSTSRKANTQIVFSEKLLDIFAGLEERSPSSSLKIKDFQELPGAEYRFVPEFVGTALPSSSPAPNNTLHWSTPCFAALSLHAEVLSDVQVGPV